MLRRLFAPVSIALLSGGMLLSPLRAGGSKNTKRPERLAAQTEAIQPFTHVVQIPAGADLGAIRFEGMRLVKVPTRIRYTTDPDFCQELAFSDSAESMACPYAHPEALVQAYEATYSFVGQPLASDEYAGRNFTFSVYFRVDEVAPDVQKALAGRKLSRADIASYFDVSTYRETVSQVAIDNRQSRFCDTNFNDGAWTHTDTGCKDDIHYSEVTVPSDYITVKVGLVPQRHERTAAIVTPK